LCSKYADMSMLSFAKIMGAVHSSPVLAAYRAHPGLQQRLGSNCRVRLTFGLHEGWAIEGAVGSEFKIDASYLSPNVSIASDVELATKNYAVPIIISESVIKLASDAMADKCRLIDRVVIKGSTSPLRLYSLDLNYQRLSVEAPRHSSIVWNLRERFKARQYLEQAKNRKLSNDFDCAAEFDRDKDIATMRRRYTTDFTMLFHMGFQNYAGGEWDVAKRLLSDAQSILKGTDDGPSKALLRFMSSHDFKAPKGWMGIRDL